MKPLRRRNVINRLYVIPIVSLVFFSPFARAEPGPKDLAARTELHSIETLTLSDTQFLTGDANGKPTTTSGQFRSLGLRPIARHRTAARLRRNGCQHRDVAERI